MPMIVHAKCDVPGCEAMAENPYAFGVPSPWRLAFHIGTAKHFCLCPAHAHLKADEVVTLIEEHGKPPQPGVWYATRRRKPPTVGIYLVWLRTLDRPDIA